MTRFLTIAIAVFAVATFTVEAKAQLFIFNGSFDEDADLGGADDPDAPPLAWFTNYRGAQTWSDFRFGNDGNGSWDNNGLAFGQNFTGENFDPGPEDGYYYTSLGRYLGEVSAEISGLGYNRTNGNPAGVFDVSLYFSPGATFAAADGTDVAAGTVLLASTQVDISALTGFVANSQPFSLTVPFAGTGISPLDEVWLRFGDGPDDNEPFVFDEPIIDNVALLAVVPEPSAILLALVGAGLWLAAAARRRR